ncbi:MAG: YdcF family protein [Oscillospiraceae bacterium]|nr:YdcF family protein [Oscillospiraceae bacterium]
MKHNHFFLFAAVALAALAFALMIVPGFQFSIILCFAFAALLVLMYFLRRSPAPAASRFFKVICLFLILGIIAAAITGSFIVSAAHQTPQPDSAYIVVLGAGVRGTVPSLTLRERINGAYAYLSANPDTIAILCGGQGPGEDMTEAACMYRELTGMGIDGSRLLLEDQSTSTIENLTFALEKAEAATGVRPEKIGIVSSEYHLFRACQFAGDLELEAFGIPARTSWFALRLNYYLREIVAVWKYLLLGP